MTPETPKNKRFQFIKITDNRNHPDFIFDCTTMRDARLRISALKAQYKKFLNDGENEKPIFRFFELDYSFCVVERGVFDDRAKYRLIYSEESVSAIGIAFSEATLSAFILISLLSG